MVDEATIAEAGRRIGAAAPEGSRVILFGSHARGEANSHSDVDILVIEPEVENATEESVRLYRTLRDLRIPIDVLVIDEAKAGRRAKVKGTVVERALREGRDLGT
jgi:predicted nucleotidyltransferase